MSSTRGTLPRWVWVLAGLGLLGLAVYALRDTLTPILCALGIAYLLDPLVDRFEQRGIPRSLGIVILLALTLGGMALVALLIVPGVVREVIAFSEELPQHLERLRAIVEPWLTSHGVEVPHSFEELRQLIQPAADKTGSGEIATRAATVLGTIGEWIWGGTSSILAVIGTVLIVPVFAFYLLHDFDRMTLGLRDLVPFRYRPFVVDVAKEIDQVLGQFVRGQLLVMLILAVLYSVAYSIVGIRLAVPIGIVAGLLSFIPYVGGASALVLALLMCALGWQGWWQVIGVGIAYGIIQILEGFVITPRIVGDKVGLAAVWVLVALMVGGELFGFAGVLLAVPSAAVAKIFVVRAIAYYRKSRVYLGDGPHEQDALIGMLEEPGLPDPPELALEKAVTGELLRSEPKHDPNDVVSEMTSDGSDNPEVTRGDPRSDDAPEAPGSTDDAALEPRPDDEAAFPSTQEPLADETPAPASRGPSEE